MPPVPSLYTALAENIRLLSQIEAADGEMTQEMEELLSLNEGKIASTSAKMFELRDLAMSQVNASLDRVAAEEALQAQHLKTVALLDKRFGQLVDQIGPVYLNAHSVSYSESIASDVTDPALLPEEYQRTVPAKTEPDKAKILKALRAGTEVPSAQLKTNKKLVVK